MSRFGKAGLLLVLPVGWGLAAAADGLSVARIGLGVGLILVLEFLNR